MAFQAIREELKSQHKTLKSQYDAKAGGYNIPDKADPNETRFIPSKLTPAEGGYFADKSNKEFYDVKYAKQIKAAATEAQAVSARIPFKRVNPSIIQGRKSRRKQRILAYGRSGTILTSTLGGSPEDKIKKRTLLG